MMEFSKTCPLCKKQFSSIITYMAHIRNKHSKVSPEEFVKNTDELKWSFRENA